MRATPSIDVVIAARNEASQIGACIEALQRQGYPRDRVRIFVVDNSSCDATATVARSGGAHVLVQPRPGAAAARNLGIRAGQGELIAFLDGHCLVDPNWLDRMVQPFLGARVGGTQGAIENRSSDRRVQRYLTSSQALANERVLRDTVRAERSLYPWLLGGNALYRRAAVERVGGFNEQLLACEDVDLAWRVLLMGYQFEYVPGASLVHNDGTSWRTFVGKSFGYGRGAARVARIYARHGAAQGLRPTLRRGDIDSVLRSLYYSVGFNLERLRLQIRRKLCEAVEVAPVDLQFRPWFEWVDGCRVRVSPYAVYWFRDDAVSIGVHLPTRCRVVLTATADFMWRHLARELPRVGIVREIVDHYGVAQATAEADLDELVEELVEVGLVEKERFQGTRGRDVLVAR